MRATILFAAAALFAAPALADQTNIYERQRPAQSGPKAQGAPSVVIPNIESEFACPGRSAGRGTLTMEIWENGAARLTGYFFDKGVVVGQKMAFGAETSTKGTYESNDINFPGHWVSRRDGDGFQATMCWGTAGANACRITTGTDAPVPEWCKG